MPEAKSTQLIKGLSVQSLLTFSNSVLQLVVFAIFSRILSREDFGYYAALMGYVGILNSLSDAGIGSSIIQKKNLTQSYRSTAFMLCLISGTVMSLFNIFASPYIAGLIIDDTMRKPIILMSLGILLFSVQGFAVSSLRKQLLFKLVGTCKLLSYSIGSIIGIVMACNGFGIYSLVGLFLIDSVIYTFLLYMHVEKPKFLINLLDAKHIFTYGGWLTLGVITTGISSQIDKLLLGRLLGIRQLGEYNRPSGFISNTIGTMNIVVDIVLFPILSDFQDSKKHFADILYKSVSLLGAFSAVISCFLFFNTPLIISIFFGTQWLDLIPIMKIASLSALFMMINTLTDIFFRSFNLVRAGFYIRLMGLILILCMLFIGAQGGIVGVAVAVLFSNFILVVVKLIYLSTKSGIEFKKLLKHWIYSSRSVIPIATVGILGTYLPYGWFSMIINLLLMLLAALLIFLKYPKLVCKEYTEMLFPKIQVLIKK